MPKTRQIRFSGNWYPRDEKETDDNRTGFTLMEVLLAVAVTSMVMIGLYQVTESAWLAYEQNRRKQDLMSQAHYALRRMTLFVGATDYIKQPDTVKVEEKLEVAERLLDTYENTDENENRTYFNDGDGLLDADNDSDSLIDEGCSDDDDTVAFKLDKSDPENWKLTEKIPDYATADLDDSAPTRVISENVTAFSCRLVTANLIEISLTLKDGSETVTLKTRAHATRVTSYAGPGHDSNQPTPDPAAWASSPAAVGCNRISMKAALATDDKTPVQYYFECTAGPGHDSGWQTSNFFTDTGLADGTDYTYRVRTRDQSEKKNKTGWSSLKSATTDSAPVITVDSVSTSPGDDVQVVSWPHTVSSAGSGRILIVGMAYNEMTSKGVETATYGGRSLSLAGLEMKPSNASSEMWYLLDPPTGTHTIVVTMKDKVKLRGGAISFFNVDQSTPKFYSINRNSSTPSLTIPDVREEEVIVDHLTVENTPSASPGPGQTLRWDGAYSSDVRTVCSTKDGPPGGGTVTVAWTLGDHKKWALCAVVLKPGGC